MDAISRGRSIGFDAVIAIPYRVEGAAATDSMIFNTIAKGRRGTVMAPFADQLTPEEIWKIVEFLRDKNRQRHLKQQ